MEIEELLKSINPLYIEDLQNPTHPSIYIREDEYKIFIIRSLDLSAEGLCYSSRGIVIDSENKIFEYNRETKSLDKSAEGYAGLYDLMSPIYARTRKIVENYIFEIDTLEDSLYERKDSRIFMDIWFEIKKDLSRIERYFSRNHQVMQEFLKSNCNNPEFQELEFRDLIEEILINITNVNSQSSRLNALYNYYSSIKNDKLNKNIYMLTIISAVFLPLNLIVGFFGMNTEGLFFKDQPLATQYVLTLIIASLLVSVFGLPLVRIIDRYILKTFLGRYRFYNKAASKLEEMLSID